MRGASPRNAQVWPRRCIATESAPVRSDEQHDRLTGGWARVPHPYRPESVDRVEVSTQEQSWSSPAHPSAVARAVAKVADTEINLGLVVGCGSVACAAFTTAAVIDAHKRWQVDACTVHVEPVRAEHERGAEAAFASSLLKRRPGRPAQPGARPRHRSASSGARKQQELAKLRTQRRSS
eukprot:scaffold305752_cov30-Tisochrysis_lutea.AAC.7